MRIKTWAWAGVCAASTALLLAATTAPAGAAGIATGQTLGAGDSRCTDYVQSDNGARLTGFFANGTGEWTVLRSSAVGRAGDRRLQGLRGFAKWGEDAHRQDHRTDRLRLLLLPGVRGRR